MTVGGGHALITPRSIDLYHFSLDEFRFCDLPCLQCLLLELVTDGNAIFKSEDAMLPWFAIIMGCSDLY